MPARPRILSRLSCLSLSSLLVVALALAGSAFAEEPASRPATSEELSARIEALEKKLKGLLEKAEEEELQKLRQQAETESVKPEVEAPKERAFVEASRSLQMLNPELSVSGDFIGTVIAREGLYASEQDRSGFSIRGLSAHIQSSLDPFSFTKLALHFSPEHGVDLEELYITWSGLIPRVSLTVGRFRQLFGVLNRWHEHDLDQVDYPLGLTGILGAEGITQTGISIRWLMPALIAHTNELTLEVTDGSNEALFSGEHFSVPSFLLHLKNYYDLNENTYLELGLSGSYGFNHRHGVADPANPGAELDEARRATLLGGVDLTIHWQPLRQARYRSMTFRTEALWAQKETLEGTKRRWGLYSYLQYQAGESWFLGVRGDVVQPLARLLPEHQWQVVPYVTFWQSEFVYLRLEARHGDGFAHGRDTRFLFQVNWAAGPHKHEKY
jgi:hypothetical protein